MLVNLSPDPRGDDTYQIQNAINSAMAHVALKSGNAAHITLNPGRFNILSPLKMKYTADTSAKISISGYGRRATQIYFDNKVEPVFDVGTTTGNLRDIHFSNFSVLRGGYGFRTTNSAYILFENIAFDKQWIAAHDIKNSYDECVNNWYVHGHRVANLWGGHINILGGKIGEDMGGFYALGAGIYLRSVDCHGLLNKGSERPVDEAAYFDITTGGWLHATDCNMVIKDVSSVVRMDYPRNVLIENCVLSLNNVNHFLLGRIFDAGTKPNAAFRHTGGNLIIDEKPFKYYKSLNYATRGLKRGLVNTLIEHKNPSLFEWGDDFLNNGNRALSQIDVNTD
jgi:tetrahydromethanopterin S-methyltransferase subunit G